VRIFFAICFFVNIFLLSAQNGKNKVFSFLEMPNSSRLTALGGNMASINDGDISLVLTNPSLINDSVDKGIAINYTNYFSDINYGFLTYSHTFEKVGSFAGSLQYLNYGNFTQTDYYGNVLGEFNSYDMAVTIGWGRVLHPGFSIGANVKFIYSDLNDVSASGIGVDVAGTYFNDENFFSTTLAIRNAGRQIKTYNGISEPFPFDMQLAFSKRFEHVPLRFSALIHHLHKWDICYFNPEDIQYDPISGLPIEERKISVFGDKLMRHIIFGAEFAPSRSLSFRIGYNYQRRKELTVASRLSTVGLSWGFGFRIKYFYLSYARSAYHLAGSPNVITITTNINDFL
jgi:hypothetical protein